VDIGAAHRRICCAPRASAAAEKAAEDIATAAEEAAPAGGVFCGRWRREGTKSALRFLF